MHLYQGGGDQFGRKPVSSIKIKRTNFLLFTLTQPEDKKKKKKIYERSVLYSPFLLSFSAPQWFIFFSPPIYTTPWPGHQLPSTQWKYKQDKNFLIVFLVTNERNGDFCLFFFLVMLHEICLVCSKIKKCKGHLTLYPFSFILHILVLNHEEFSFLFHLISF